MKSKSLRKAVICAGLVMTMSATVLPQTPVVNASALSTDTALAGISLILDNFYDESKEAEVTVQNIVEPEIASRTIEPKNEAAISTQREDDEPEAPAEAVAAPVSKYENLGISIANDYVNIRKRPNTESRILGKLYKGAAATIVKKQGDWVKIQSGSVTGWISSEFLAIGFDAEELEGKYGTKWATIKTTTLFVREKPTTKSSKLCMVGDEEKFQIKKELKEWVKVFVDASDERDDSTVGFISKDYVDISVTFKEAVSIAEEKAEARRKAEAEAALAAAKAAREAQAAQNNSSSNSNSTYVKPDSSSSNRSSSSSNSSSSSSSSNSSSSSSSSSSSNSSSSSSSSSSSNSNSSSNYTPSGASGAAIASFAQKFIGNPYVYGGTSLTNGTDCSGFTQSVFSNFGISIPRTSSSQSCSGQSVSVSNVQPGDLIFYARNGRINHVAMYIGGGQVVHASNPETGIRTSNMYYRQPSCARRYW